MRPLYGFISAITILAIYCAFMYWFVEPIVVRQLVLKAKDSNELFKATYIWLLLLNAATLYYIVFRHTAIAGRKLYIPIFWIAFVVIFSFASFGIIGKNAYAYGLPPIAKVMSNIDFTSKQGWSSIFMLFLVLPSIAFAAYIKPKKQPHLAPGSALGVAQAGSFIFGAGLAAYQYQMAAKSSATASSGDITSSGGTESADVPDLF